MNKEEYHLIIDEAYDKYFSHFLGYDDVPPKEVFVFLCKTDKSFSERWGLKIEERELSLEERKSIYEKEYTDGIEVANNHWLNSKLTTRNIPTKLITIIYNDKTIESYE